MPWYQGREEYVKWLTQSKFAKIPTTYLLANSEIRSDHSHTRTRSGAVASRLHTRSILPRLLTIRAFMIPFPLSFCVLHCELVSLNYRRYSHLVTCKLSIYLAHEVATRNVAFSDNFRLNNPFKWESYSPLHLLTYLYNYIHRVKNKTTKSKYKNLAFFPKILFRIDESYIIRPKGVLGVPISQPEPSHRGRCP